MSKQRGKPFSFSHPNHVQWKKLEVLPHFILWGKVSQDETVAHLAITERKPHRTVWATQIEASRTVMRDTHGGCLHILQKFERLWPCHFLAKEFEHDEGI